MSLPISGVPTAVDQPGQLPGADPGGVGPGSAARQPATHVLARMGRAIRSNRKATVGTVLLAIFLFAALFPGLIAKDDPGADAYQPKLGISTAHLLGTTAQGQEMWAQLV